MKKLMTIALGLAIAIGASMSVGTEVEAAKKSAPKSKACKATSLDGKKVSFRCKANESCCYDGLMAKGNCVPAGQVCF